MRPILAILPLLLVAACDEGHGAESSGRGSERSFAVGAFQRIALAGSHQVIVSVGGNPSVRAVGPSEALDRLDIRVRDGELIVGNKNRAFWSWGSTPKVIVYVTAPSLEAAAIAGSGDMKIDKVEAAGFQAAISGSGDLSLPAVKVDDASFTISGSGSMDARGSARTVRVSVTGSGDIDGGGFQATDARVSIIGSGGARLKATGSADITITGSGDAAISGGAKCRVSRTGSGRADCTA